MEEDEMISIIEAMSNESFMGQLCGCERGYAFSDGSPVFENIRLWNESISSHDYKMTPNDSIFLNTPRSETCECNTPRSETYQHDDEEIAADKVFTILSNCLFRKSEMFPTDESRDTALIQALELMKQYHIKRFDHYCRGLVYSPERLKDFLDYCSSEHIDIGLENLGVMMSRCIETHHFISSIHLIDYKIDLYDEHKINPRDQVHIEMKLLCKKYSINHKIYDIAKRAGFSDSYYDAYYSNEPYTYTHKLVMDKIDDGYVGFRDFYHALMYGEEEHYQSMLIYWDEYGKDCTLDAAREFFALPENYPVDLVQEYVWENRNKSKLF